MATDPRKLIDGLIRSFNNLKTATKGLNGANLNKMFSSTSKELKGMTKDVKYLVSAMYEEDEAVEKATKSIKKYKDALKKGMAGSAAGYAKMQMAWYPVKAFTLKTIGIPKDVITSYADFSDALTQVRSVGQLTDTQLNSLGTTIRDIGVTTKFSAIEIAKAATVLAQAGFRGAELEQALKPIALMATATSSNMQTGVDVMTTVVRAYGLSATQFVDISDTLTNAVVNSKLSLQDLATSFSYVASAASQTGVTFTETVTLLGVLANAGLKASTAATGLRMALLKIAAPTRKAKKVLDRLGLSKKDLDIANRGIKNVLNTLSEIDTVDIIDIFGARSANAVLALRSVGTEAISALEEVITIQGTSAAIANEQLLTLTKSWKNLLDKFTEVKIATGENFGESLALKLRAVGDMVIDISKHLEGILTVSKGIIVTWGAFKVVGLVRAFAPLLALKKDLPLLARGVSDFKESWVAFGKESTGAVNRLHTSLKYSVGDLAKGMGGLLATMAPLLAGAAVIFGGKMAFDWFYDTYVSAEKFKTAMVESEAAFARMAADSQQLIITLGNLSNLNVGEGVSNLLITAQKGKLSTDTSSMYDKAITAMSPYSAVVVASLEKQKKEQLTKIENLLSIEDVKEFAINGRKDLDTYLDSLINGNKDLSAKVLSSIWGDLGDINGADFVAGAKLKEFLKEWKDNTANTFTASLEAFMNDSRILKKVSEARNFVSGLLGSIATPTSYDELGALKKKSLGLKQYWEQLMELRKKAPEGSKGAGMLDDSILNVSMQRNATDNAIAGFSLSKKAEGDFKVQLAQKVKSLGSKALVIYQNSIKILGNDIKTSKSMSKNFILEVMLDLIKQSTNGEDITPELRKMAESMTDTTMGAMGDTLSKKSNTKKLTLINAEIGSIESELVLLDKQGEKYKEKKTRLETLLKDKQETEDLQAKLNGTSLKILQYKREKDKNVQTAKDNKQTAADDKKALQDKRKNIQDTIDLYQTLEDNLTAQRKYQMDRGAGDIILLPLNDQLNSLHPLLIQAKKDLIELSDASRPLKSAQEAALDFDAETFNQNLDKSKNAISDFKDSLKDMFTGSIQGFFDDLIDGSKSVSDAFADMARELVKSFASLMANRVIQQGMDSLFSTGAGTGVLSFLSAFVHHKGGVVGDISTPTRSVNPMLFAGAARYHSGLAGDEFPAILQKGETVIPKGYSQASNAPKVTINMTNQSNQQIQMKTTSVTENNEEYIVNTVIQNIANNGALRSII